MVIKRFIFLLGIYITSSLVARAQDDEFCEAVNAITADASNQFRNIKGRMIESNMNAIMWASGIKVPGAINTRFVSAMGLFYECAFFQTKDKESLQPIYEKYKNMLNACLGPQGYKMSEQPNFYPGMADFKKLVFMQEPKEDAVPDTTATTGHISRKAPPHITLEADYGKESGKYTVVMYIFEH